MIAHPFPAAMGLDAAEDVKAGFKPGCETVCDFNGLVQRMIGGKDAVNFLALAIDGEVAVEFDHGAARGDGLGAVDLDFVVVLGRERKGQEAESDGCGSEAVTSCGK